MTRLINADTLKEEIIDLLEIEWGYEGIREDVSRIIDSMPTVEQRPHGEWVFKNDNPLISTGYWECSKCKKGRLMVEENFCPNCGADMRKEGDAE